jgi:hypothetical protein
MPSIRLVEAKLPEFGRANTRPEIPRAHYAERLSRLLDQAEEAGHSTIVVYADREHSANMAYLVAFEPRFEEALLILKRDRRPIILAGPENAGRAAAGPMEIEAIVYPPFGLLGQDRSKTKPLAEIFRSCGIDRGESVGTIGWKYFGSLESPSPSTWLEVPSYIADTLRDLVSKDGQVVNATALLMDASHGLRATNEIAQLAQFEHSACEVSEGLKRVLFGIKVGMRESDAAKLIQPASLPLSCHTMLSSGARAVFGLESPGDRILGRGDQFTMAYGVWGALSARAGWLVSDADELPDGIEDYVERLAAPYFACAAEWYETVGIGVTGGEIDALVKKHLGDPFFGVSLNPGHLLHLDEWLNTPIYPGSTERLRSGQAMQLDIIPATGSAYFTTNIEDGIALLDERGRAQFMEQYPEAWQRVQARRAFMADTLGIRLKPEVVPLSNLQGYLAPYLLSPHRVFTKA